MMLLLTDMYVPGVLTDDSVQEKIHSCIVLLDALTVNLPGFSAGD